MANKALEEINAQITKLQDQLRQADAARDAALKAHGEKYGDITAKLADWAEVLDRYHGTAEVEQPTAKKTAAKKTAPAK